MILFDGLTHEINFSEVPGVLRILLLTDGTVTRALESFFLEKINIKMLQQDYVKLTEPLIDLNKMVGNDVFKRTVELRSDKSDICYVKAESYILLNDLAPDLKQQFLIGEMGIGEILNQSQLETYRKITRIYCEQQKNTTYYYRDYIIGLYKKPLIRITERFDIHHYISR